MIARTCLLILLLTTASGAAAQSSGVAGQWSCQQANQTVSNNNFENWIYQFYLRLDPNGAFQAQGNYTAATAGYAVPFWAQGRWQQSQGGVFVQGYEQRQDGVAQAFTLVFTLVGPASMSNRYSGPAGNMLTYCQR